MSPAARDDAVDEEGLRDVAVLRDHRLAVLLRQDARAVGEREQHVVPLRQEADRRGRVGRGERRALEVEQLAAVLVAEAAQRLERFERLGEVGDAHARPVCEIRAARGTEGAEVAPDELGAGGRRLHDLGLVDRGESACGLDDQSAVSGACSTCPPVRAANHARRRVSSSTVPCVCSRCSITCWNVSGPSAKSARIAGTSFRPSSTDSGSPHGRSP